MPTPLTGASSPCARCANSKRQSRTACLVYRATNRPIDTSIVEEGFYADTECGECGEVTGTTEYAGMVAIPLPTPGQLSDHHMSDETVWYHGQDGEFVISQKVSEPYPVYDSDGNCWSVTGLREMAAAALAAACEVEKRQQLGKPEVPLVAADRVVGTMERLSTEEDGIAATFTVSDPELAAVLRGPESNLSIAAEEIPTECSVCARGPAGQRLHKCPDSQCLAMWGGHLCRRPRGHDGAHSCGEPSAGNPCGARWD